MKKYVSLLSFFVLLSVLSIPAFAVDTTYVPPIPPFLNASGGSVTFKTPVPKNNNAGITSFFADFDQSPHLILIEQWSRTGLYMEEDLGEDRVWWVDFVKYPKSTTTKSIGGFAYTGSSAGNGYFMAPMLYSANKSQPYERVSMKYDFKLNKFISASSVTKGTSPITFSYVFSGSALSNSVVKYPGYNRLAGNYTFDSVSRVDGIERNYNWWLGIIKGIPSLDINVDTDGNGKPDLNVDTDGDGEADLNVDTNGDKKPDLNVDTDGDGKPDLNVDTDKDGKPDLDIDTNGDGKPDVNVDTNGDKKPDINIDTDGDQRPDINIDTNGDGKPDINIDTNGDKKPDINVDSNGDKKSDINVDTDGNGKPDINIDTDGNGKPDINVDTNGDGKPDINVDTDGNNKPDINVDTDGDGKPDTNIPPGGGGSGGGTGGGGTVIPPKDEDDLIYNGWNLFDPFDYNNYTPPTYSGNDPYTDYDPLDGFEYNGGFMPGLPELPAQSPDFQNPFLKPY